MVRGRLLPSPAAPCPPLDSNAPPLEEGWGQADSGRGALPPQVCAWVVGTSMEVKMPCAVCGPGSRAGGNRASLEGQMAAAVF